MSTAGHNIDRYAFDLRNILSLGNKRIALLIGSGAPASVLVNARNELEASGKSLIPTLVPLTKQVLEIVQPKHPKLLSDLQSNIGGEPNIESILGRARSLASVLGTFKTGDFSGNEYETLANDICGEIGKIVSPSLPTQVNPYTELVGWIAGAKREHALEIFTSNYDLLLEEALERSKVPYFDGFTGAHEPFFDSATVSSNDLPKRWVRVWKIHGSLGWTLSDGKFVRNGNRSSSSLIYPSELKYQQSQKLPFQSLFDRLRKFLETPDSLLITVGFSFEDQHIASTIEEALAANPSTSVFAMQFNKMDKEPSATALAKKRANLSVYCKDAAIINCIHGKWLMGDPPTKSWHSVRPFFSHTVVDNGQTNHDFLLGDFKYFAKFFASVRSETNSQEI